MKFDKLAQSVKEIYDKYSQTKGETIYSRILEPGYNLNDITIDDCEKMFDFLNIWGRCRLKRNPSALLARLQKVAVWIDPTRQLRIENSDLNLIIR